MTFISTFALFKVGIGPSSSHTVGPMRAAGCFRRTLEECFAGRVHRIDVRLFGSLAHTGRGHQTDRAVVWGLAGLEPESFDADLARQVWADAQLRHTLRLDTEHEIVFHPDRDLVFDFEREPGAHPNELLLEAFDESDRSLHSETWFSVGGGFISRPEDLGAPANPNANKPVPYAFTSGRDLLELTRRTGLSIAELVRENERTVRDADTVSQQLAQLWNTMNRCIERGLVAGGVLPGGLQVKRRAAALYQRLCSKEPRMKGRPQPDHSDWVHLWAMAVNEENAAGGQVVTAPTNGAAGIVPAVLKYYLEYVDDGSQPLGESLETYFFTAAAIGTLFKLNASISGAEVGCQGEVGSAASMAAGGLCALLGGSPAQIEQAAEIAIEHNLGLTCDPVGGLVQVPCIERNGFGATKAIGAARLAMHEDGAHHVSLDRCIETMRRTGQDMSTKYKETSLGGLAVAIVEC